MHGRPQNSWPNEGTNVVCKEGQLQSDQVQPTVQPSNIEGNQFNAVGTVSRPNGCNCTCCNAGDRASPCPTLSTMRRNTPVYTTLALQPKSMTGTTSTARDSGLNNAKKATPLQANPAPIMTFRLIFSDTSAATLATKMKAIAAIISNPPSAEAVVAKATFKCSGRITSLKATVADTRIKEANDKRVC
mmetsp:Transcript_41716/g.65127  ORF Transcript_41716/g.65127 Transcript_41716/m.65127 type:complete len:188 (+) Transcript_41716:1971-2534(+)